MIRAMPDLGPAVTTVVERCLGPNPWVSVLIHLDVVVLDAGRYLLD